jgi:hypothetical protein
MTTAKSLALAAIAIAATVFAATVGCAQDMRAAPPQAPRFSLPADTSTPVLKLTFRCGDCERTLTYILTSDGNLVRILNDPPDPERRKEKMLSRERTEQLVALVVNRGLMSSSDTKIRQALRARGGEKRVADGGDVVLEMHLASLQEGEKRSDNPSTRLAVTSLGAQYHAYKDIPEITGMQLLFEEFKKEIG